MEVEGEGVLVAVVGAVEEADEDEGVVDVDPVADDEGKGKARGGPTVIVDEG